MRYRIDEVMQMTDLVIIGGGPAGVSAALTALHRGKTVQIVSSAAEDSPLWRAEHVDNYPGLPAVTGRELIEKLTTHAEKSGAEFVRGRALSVMPMGGAFGISVGSDFLQARAIVLAAGLSRAAEYPGEREFLGAGVSYCATCDGMLYRNKRVAVIGLSSDAPEEAEFLRSIGCEVEYFDKKSAKKYEIRGTERVEALIADGVPHPVDCVFILRSGIAPDALMSGLTLDGGKIAVDSLMTTNIPGVFACGDCIGGPFQVAKAVGDGNIAGISAAKYIETQMKGDQ